MGNTFKSTAATPFACFTRTDFVYKPQSSKTVDICDSPNKHANRINFLDAVKGANIEI